MDEQPPVAPDGRHAPRLEGPRILLRPVRLDDVGARYCGWLNDADVNRYLETRSEIQTLETVAAYVRRVMDDRDQFFWAICVKADGSHIGNLKLGPVSAVHRRAAMSLFIGEKAVWGRGYAAEAIATACEFAFGGAGLHKLAAGVYADNKGSIRAFEKCGFAREGTLRSHAWCNGAYTDVILLGRVAPQPVPGGVRA